MVSRGWCVDQFTAEQIKAMKFSFLEAKTLEEHFAIEEGMSTGVLPRAMVDKLAARRRSKDAEKEAGSAKAAASAKEKASGTPGSRLRTWLDEGDWLDLVADKILRKRFCKLHVGLRKSQCGCGS